MITYPLTLNELSSLYFQLQQNGAFCRGENKKHFDNLSLEEILAIALEESRWDFRLLGILIDFFQKNFIHSKPFLLKNYIQKNQSPSVIGVVEEWVYTLDTSSDIKDFFALLTKDLKQDDEYKLFNVGQVFILKNIQKEASNSLMQFKKWGFLCSEIPLLKENLIRDKKLHLYSKEERMNILKELLASYGEISLKEYLKAIKHSVTRQHARLDILSYKGIKQKGTTKGSVYSLKK